MKPSYEFNQRGPFVLPDTPGGRRIIRRAMRKGRPFDHRIGESYSAGPAKPGRTPVFAGNICSSISEGFFAEDILSSLFRNLGFSRVDVRASTDSRRVYCGDDAVAAWCEWKDCYDAARDPLCHLTREDKANAKTMRAAIIRERAFAAERAKELERQQREEYDRRMWEFLDERLGQFRAVNPRALLLILCKIEGRTQFDAVAAAFPHLRFRPRRWRARLWARLVGEDHEAQEWYELLKMNHERREEEKVNRRLRPNSSANTLFTDMQRRLMTPEGLASVRAEVERLPRVGKGEKAPTRRSQLLALGIPA